MEGSIIENRNHLLPPPVSIRARVSYRQREESSQYLELSVIIPSLSLPFPRYPGPRWNYSSNGRNVEFLLQRLNFSNVPMGEEMVVIKNGGGGGNALVAVSGVEYIGEDGFVIDCVCRMA